MVFFYTLSFAEPQESQKRTTRNKRTTGTFILDHFQSKLMTSFSLKVQKPCFRAIFTFLDIFPKTWTFPKTCLLSLSSLWGPLNSCTVSKETNEWIPRKKCYKWINEHSNRCTVRLNWINRILHINQGSRKPEK